MNMSEAKVFGGKNYLPDIMVGDIRFVWNRYLPGRRKEWEDCPPNTFEVLRENTNKQYLELASRGMGTVTERTILDDNGEEEPILAFYRHSEVPTSWLAEINRYLMVNHRQAFGILHISETALALSTEEVTRLVDVALAETGVEDKLNGLGLFNR